ncbi:MAG: serine/threonine-protein kinase [Planctomycetota bacterium]|nr:serine/threonine-protein kinase [Planctomycetota bacterium]
MFKKKVEFGAQPGGSGIDLTDTTRFKLARKIADGGMGSVYEAIQYGADGFEKVMALKVIQEGLSRDPEFVEMFIGEAKLVADLLHINIVQIYQLGKIDDLYYIAMEYVNGVNLQEFMGRHLELGLQLPVDLATYIISRIARALEYAHRKTDKFGNPLGIVHRDVCPKNIMINTEGVVKLADFGIAKNRKFIKDQEGEVLMGKAQYMSPEQAQYLPTDKRSDVFSLGIVFWQLLTGQDMFASDKTSVTLENVVYKEVVPARSLNPEIPQEVNQIVMRALERNLTKRYQDAGRMAYDLEFYMYHDRFGPTFVDLEKYMASLFPQLYVDRPKRDYTPPRVFSH